MSSILITGGTGSFGHEFVRTVLRENLSDRVCVFSRGELKQTEMRQEFKDDSRLRWLIGDVRDRERLRRAMEGCDVVVHAAALKRIEVCHYCPEEVIKTNIDGSRNVIEAAQDACVEKVVALSTDKAWQPVSAYGYTKALAECLFLSTHSPITKFAVVRYGNVSGSNGSVIPTWRSMKAAGKTTVPVSDPNVTRFWMYLQEAVDLVLNTLSTMKGGELVIPELPAYRLGDLAEAMEVEMDVKGLGHWEKRHEGMCDGNTSDKARRMTVNELREGLAHV